jgi:putative copper export protein
MVAFGLIVAMTESASGHASDAGDLSMAEFMDWFHLVAASVWGGGLFVLAIVIFPKIVEPGDLATLFIAVAAARFSRIAGIAVGIIAVTALYNAWFYVGSYEALWKTHYGLTVIAKIILFLLLIILGAFNRYSSVPLLQHWAGISPDNRGIINRIANRLFARFLRNQNGYRIAIRFMCSVRIEAFLIIGVLLCAALLRHEVPARHHAHLEHARVIAAPGTEPIVSLETNPAKITVGVPVALTVRIKNRGGSPLQGLAVSHERILHAVIVSKDLGVFAHIHPEEVGRVSREMMKKAVFPLRFTFPKAGKYLLGLDFATADNFYSKIFSISVTGKPTMGKPKLDLSREKDFEDYRVTLSISPKNIKAGEETTLRYFIEKDEKAVTNLAPYLDAEMHLAVVSADLKHYIHVHGVTPGEPHASHDHMHTHPPKRFGPEIQADIVFPVKGTYKIFSQVNHHGKVLLFDFMMNVQ